VAWTLLVFTGVIGVKGQSSQSSSARTKLERAEISTIFVFFHGLATNSGKNNECGEEQEMELGGHDRTMCFFEISSAVDWQIKRSEKE